MKSPLIRRLSFGAQWLHTSVCAHRAPKLKPPSERQFDAPRQKLAALASEVLEKGALPLSAIGEANFAYPQTVKDSVVCFRILCFFYSTAKLAKLVLLYFKTVKNSSRGTSLSLLRQKGGLTVASFIILSCTQK